MINFNLKPLCSTIRTISRFNINFTFLAHYSCTDSTTYSFLSDTQTNNACQKFICINHFNKRHLINLFDRYNYNQ